MIDKYPEIQNQFQIIHDLFKEHGHEIRLAGGAVRDICENKEPSDLDFCTTMLPDDMMKLSGVDDWYVRPTGLHHGTVTFIKGDINIEVTTLRVDKACDGRWAEVEFTSDWKLDAARRDFTINAMMMDIDGQIFDYFDGRIHLMEGKIIFVGDAQKRIEEDSLRMLRALRFIARYTNGNQIDDMLESIFCSTDPSPEIQTLECIFENRDLIKSISVERVWNEFTKACKYPDKLLNWCKLLQLTRLYESLEIPYQVNDCYIPHLYIEKYPAFAICAYLDKTADIEGFYKKYKLSLLERKQINFFMDNFIIPGITPSENKIIDLLEQGYKRQWVAAVASSMSLSSDLKRCTELERIAYNAERPVFPVSAQNLLDTFTQLEEGRKLGSILKEVKNSWIESRYTKDYNTLISEINI